MAERRMFAKTIMDSDAFLDMPLSTQCLYFHLSMRADDDGFINNPKKIQRMIGCADDDFKLLIAKRFVIPFESGIVVIKHWKIHNYIRKDRYNETVYQEEKNMLTEKENGIYSLIEDVGIPLVNHKDTQRLPQVRLGKDRLELGKDSIDIEIKIYSPVIDYLNLKCNTKYKTSSNKTKSLIDARVNESFTFEDFKKVIDIKAAEWLKTDMEKYLRPETLFGTKFESYLNQKIVVKQDKSQATSKPNKFHNFEGKMKNYSESELEEKIRKNLKNKN